MALDPGTLAQLVDTLDRFVREALIPREAEVSETDAVPEDIRQQMRELGLFGMTIPEAWGGLGLNMSEEVQVAFVLGRASPAFRSVIGTNNGIGAFGIVNGGTEAQKAKYLPKLASGEIIGAFALTEPGAGSDAASLTTRAAKDGNGPDAGWVLDGTKRFITNAPQAGLFTVFARTDPGTKGADGISAFLVEAGTPGLTVGPKDKKMGQQGAHTADVILENCRVPADALLGGDEGGGFRTAMQTLDRGRLHMAAVSVAAAERLIEMSVDYARERKQFGKPIGEFQLVQAMLADSRTEAYAARCMVVDAARRRDAGEDVTVEASCCKLFATEMVGRVADRAVQIHGGAGYMAEYGVERFYRDVRLLRIYEGTSQIQQLIIGRAMMKGR